VTKPDMDRADVMLAACRYAMPRETYIGSSVRRYILAHMHQWPQWERDRLAIIIDQQEHEGSLGDEVADRPGWLALRDALRGGE